MSLVLDAVWSRFTRKPFNLEFAITNNCNFRCKMCNQWKNKFTNELTLAEISKIFGSYSGFKVVGLTGGEPFLRDDVPEIAKIIIDSQKALKKLFITTNGSMPAKVCRDVSKILETESQLYVLVSLDGSEKIHNEIRGRPWAYNRAIVTLELLNDLRTVFPNLHLGFVASYSPYNFEDYDLILDELERLSDLYDLENQICVCWTGNLYKNLEQKWTRSYLHNLRNYATRIKNIVSRKHSLLGLGRSLFYDFAENYLQPGHQAIPCLSGTVRYYMNSRGEVYPCVIYNECVGKLRESNYDFKQVFDSDRVKEIRKKIRNEECLNCYITCELIPTMMASPLKTLWAWL